MQVKRWGPKVVPFAAQDVARYRKAGLWAGKTIAEEFHDVANRYSDSPALIGLDRSYTYAELDRLTDRIAAGLAAAGLEPGSAAILQLNNTVETVLAWYGLLKASIIPVATLSLHRGYEVREIAAQTGATAHLVDADNPKFNLVEFATNLAGEQVAPRAVIAVRGHDLPGSVLRLEDLGADLTAAEARRVVADIQAATDDDDIAVFQLSGGTTGVPKVIPRLHGEYWYNARAYAERLGWTSATRVAYAAPLVHNAGITCALHSVHSVGGTMVLGVLDPGQLFPLMARSAVTDTLLSPRAIRALAAHPGFDEALANVGRVVLSGASVPDEVYEIFASRDIEVLQLFGMGEGLFTLTPRGTSRWVRQKTVGSPLSPADSVRIVKPGTDIVVPTGTVGEMLTKGPYTIRGYLDAEERNASAFSADGYYRSGDLMAAHERDGILYYSFEGREKQNINRGGEKINAAEIENLIIEMPGVRLAALIPFPDERLGERACLCLETDADSPPVALSDVQAYLDGREVARYKWPERVEVVEEIPRTHVGKINKTELRDLVLGPPV